MEKEGISKQYDKGIASQYASESWQNEEADLGRKFMRAQMERVPRDSVVVDVGCGNGIELKAYAKMGFTKLTGVEPSDKFRDEEKKLLGESVPILEGTFEKLPLPDNSVDALTARFSIHYTDIAKSYAEAARVLKSGGKFIVVTSHPKSDQEESRNPDGTVTITLFNGTVPITYPYHTMDEYFGENFKKYFADNPTVYEYVGVEADRGKKYPDKINSLAFAAIRK